MVMSSLALSGCSSLGHETASVPTAAPATAPVALPPLAQPLVAAPLEATSTVVETAVAEALAAHAAAKPDRPAPPQYRDVFARIRAGFKLEDSEQRAIDTQLAWYVNNPEYLYGLTEDGYRLILDDLALPNPVRVGVLNAYCETA